MLENAMKSIRWANLSIKYKMMLIYLLIVIIPILVLGFYLTYSLSNSFRKNIQDSSHSVIQLITTDFRNRMYNVADIIDSIAYNQSLNSYINTSFEDEVQSYQAYGKNIAVLFDKAAYKDKSILMKIFSKNPHLGFSGVFINTLSLTDLQITLADVENLTEKMSWDGTITVRTDDSYLVCHTPMRSFRTPRQTTAVLFTYIDLHSITSLMDTSKKSGNIVCIKDEKDRTIASTISSPISSGMVNNGKLTINGENYLALKEPLNDSRLLIRNWNILYMVPTKVVDRSITGIWLISFFLIGGCFLITYFVIHRFSKNVSHRIDHLIGGMRIFADGDMTNRIQTRHMDEIGQLTLIFNGFADKISTLISEVLLSKIRSQEAEIERQKLQSAHSQAQLLFLQGQMNPHYLFNTLESIRMNILLHGDRKSAKLIRIFAEGLREIMYNTDPMATIQRELNLVSDFIAIQKFRLGDRLNYSIACEEGLVDFSIPKFTIQPFVENAVFHGFENKTNRGHIIIDIHKENDFVSIVIRDDGIGMDKEDLAQVLSLMEYEGSSEKGLALRNIYTRLKIIYKDSFRFAMTSVKNRGTTVTILIPGGG